MLGTGTRGPSSQILSPAATASGTKSNRTATAPAAKPATKRGPGRPRKATADAPPKPAIATRFLLFTTLTITFQRAKPTREC